MTETSTALRHVLIRTPIEVRWRDLDAFNHVNNATYLTYLEQARLVWLKQVPGTWFDAHAVPVMAACEINYLRPIGWPADIVIELGCERMGKRSLTISHRIVDANDDAKLYSDGRVVVVWMDPESSKAVALPEAIVAAVKG
jgi:acyl-CoA thioester hydrolase